MDMKIRYQNYRLDCLRQGFEPMAFDEWQTEIQEGINSCKTALK